MTAYYFDQHQVWFTFHLIYLFFNADWLVMCPLSLRKCVFTCDDRACPGVNMVTISQWQGSLTPSQGQSAWWFFDTERGTDKATHQMYDDLEEWVLTDCPYNLLAIPQYFNCWRLSHCHFFCQNNSVASTYFLCIVLGRLSSPQTTFFLTEKIQRTYVMNVPVPTF